MIHGLITLAYKCVCVSTCVCACVISCYLCVAGRCGVCHLFDIHGLHLDDSAEEQKSRERERDREGEGFAFACI